VLTSLSILGAAGAGYALVNRYDGNINRLPGIFDEDRPEPSDTGPRNILIVGSDSRDDLGEEFQGVGEEFVTGQRSDVIILAHLYGDSDQAQLVSFPRDTWVEIPNHTDPETGEFVEAHHAKINSAFQEGGPALLIQTLQDLTGLKIDNYMQIDFAGFQTVVDALGGVNVCLPEPVKDRVAGVDLPAGQQVVTGEEALGLVRSRNSPRGDIDRIARQQQFLGAIVRQVLSAGTLLNPLKLNDFLDAATSSLQVDETLDIGDLRNLALRFKGFEAGGVTFTTPPIETINAARQGQSVVLLDEEGSQQLFSRLARDIPPNAPAPPAHAGEELIVRPGSIRIEVLNGSGIQGLAATAAADLAELGFQVVGPPGNRGTDARQTVIYHGPDKADSARTVAAAIPGSTTTLDESLEGTLQVVLGASYDGAQPVTVTPASPAPPEPSGETDIVSAAEDPCAA
jgi:LCP family protein required for cell wall assembly